MSIDRDVAVLEYGVQKGDFVYCIKSNEKFIEGKQYEVFAIDEDDDYSLYCIILNELNQLTTYTTKIFNEHFETKHKKRSRIISSL